MAEYGMVISPLSEEEGGGYLVRFPDLPGCVSDGATPTEAAENGQDAMRAWLEVRAEQGTSIPLPGASSVARRAMMARVAEALGAAVVEMAEIDAEMSKAEARMSETEAYIETVERVNKHLLRLLPHATDRNDTDAWMMPLLDFDPR